MKKYQLIKEYPGSPKLGTIVKDTNHTPSFTPGTSWMMYINNDGSIKRNDVLNNPEYWQEFKEKPKLYKITSIRLKNSGVILTHEKEIEEFEKNPNSCNIAEIYSVKCLEKGHELTIGDKVEYLYTSILGNITSFKVFEGYDNMLMQANPFNLNIAVLRKVETRKPLFTTEDGVVLYNRADKVYAVHIERCELLDINDGIGAWLNGWHYVPFDELQLRYKGEEYYKQVKKEFNKHVILFSSHEKAKEYILMNKQCLSIKDIMSCSVLGDKLAEQLKNIVKSR